MDIEYEANKLKEAVRRAYIEFQQATGYKYRPDVEVDLIYTSTLGESGRQYQVGNAYVKLEAEY
jgi:hypothetical protein